MSNCFTGLLKNKNRIFGMEFKIKFVRNRSIWRKSSKNFIEINHRHIDQMLKQNKALFFIHNLALIKDIVNQFSIYGYLCYFYNASQSNRYPFLNGLIRILTNTVQSRKSSFFLPPFQDFLELLIIFL